MTKGDRSGCLSALLGWLIPASGKQEQKDTSMPYHQRDDLLSPAEISFYHVLQNIVGDSAAVCPKVSLGDLFYAASGDYGENRGWMNRIDRKHVDFLLCDPGTMQPRLGVELDDTSHARKPRKQRDRFVDRVFAAADLPLARIPAQAQYNTDEVKTCLRRAVAGASDGSTSADEIQPQPEARGDGTPPPCPRCGAEMVMREVKRRGPTQGERFWGCPNFPKCRGTRDLDEGP